MTDAKLDYIGQAVLRGTLEVRTGLHIGAGKDTVEIGGIDNPVIKTPEGDPYVPGSSLKGKLRTLLEWAFGKVDPEGGPWTNASDTEDPIVRIFGTSAGNRDWIAGPTRLLLRDAHLDAAWRDRVLKEGRELTEAKTEVTIDRIAGKAADGIGARQMERVPPGARFDFEAAFRIYSFNDDDGARDRACLAWLIQGLDLLEQDALGGSGSRGYGYIRFKNLTIQTADAKPAQLDNHFRGHVFSKKKPSEAILNAVNEALGAG